jgi:uncharacterized protein YutE (UPF0331/DUF86 family)
MAVRADLVRRKLHLISEDLARLLPFREVSLEELQADDVRMAAVERMLERIVMRAVDVNEHLLSELATGREPRIARLSYRDTFLRLTDLGVYDQPLAERIAASAGLRNILVHDYNDVDRRIVHASIRSCLEDYREYVEKVDRFLDGLEDG